MHGLRAITNLLFRLQVSLKQQFLGLRELLFVAMVPLGSEEILMGEKEMDNLLQEGDLDKITQSLLKCVEKLSKASNIPQEKEEVGIKLILGLSCCLLCLLG